MLLTRKSSIVLLPLAFLFVVLTSLPSFAQIDIDLPGDNPPSDGECGPNAVLVCEPIGALIQCVCIANPFLWPIFTPPGEEEPPADPTACSLPYDPSIWENPPQPPGGLLDPSDCDAYDSRREFEDACRSFYDRAVCWANKHLCLSLCPADDPDTSEDDEAADACKDCCNEWGDWLGPCSGDAKDYCKGLGAAFENACGGKFQTL